MKDRIDVLDLDKLSRYDQDDLHQRMIKMSAFICFTLKDAKVFANPKMFNNLNDDCVQAHNQMY